MTPESGVTNSRAYQIELDLNNALLTACTRHAGAARTAYTWGLARKQEAYKATGKRPSAVELRRELPWLYAVSTCAPQEALRDRDAAFASCFRRCQLKQEGKLKGTVGFPQPKTRKQELGSIRCRHSA